MAKTLYDKIWDLHVVCDNDDGTNLIYIDRHMLHEVTTPQAFEGLGIANRKVWNNSSCVATEDHSIPTKNIEGGVSSITDSVARLQVETLEKNVTNHNILNFNLGNKRQGIVHVIGPENGYILPGMTVVCGDSHTSTNGAFATLAHGIGTSEVEHVLATQTLVQKKLKNMQIVIDGKLRDGVCAKDVILYIIGKIGIGGGTGYAIEFAGSVIRDLSMEGRMTICNMSIEAGAKVGLIAPDEVTYSYLQKTPFAPKGEQWDLAMQEWQQLYSDTDTNWDLIVEIDAEDINPQVTWGTNPEMVVDINGNVPSIEQLNDDSLGRSYAHALDYMAIEPGTATVNLQVDSVFIGSCTNARIEDLRAAAAIVDGKTISDKIKLALIVPGSGLVKQQAEIEGLNQIFTKAGFEWRSPGCSMCLGMNNDQLPAGDRCASTSNRNFEGRQGTGGRTHLVSPQMAAAAALYGHFVDVRNLQLQ